MATEKVWQLIPSYVLGNASTQTSLCIRSMWFRKAALTGEIAGKDQASAAVAIGAMTGKWAMYYSCDGVTAGTAGDGVDRLRSGGAGVCTETDFVYGAAGSAHSWFVLYNATLGLYYLVSYEGADNKNVRIAFSPNAFTGGTTTARPTAVNESSGYAGGVNSDSPLSPNTANVSASRAHLALAADGAFVIVQSRDGVCVQGLEILAKTYGSDASDVTYNGVHYFEGGKTGANSIALFNTFANYSNWGGRTHLGGNISQLCASAPVTNNSQYDLDNIDAITNKYGDWPIYMRTYSPHARRGRLQDIKLGATPLNDGDTDPLVGQVEFIIMGICQFPMCEALAGIP